MLSKKLRVEMTVRAFMIVIILFNALVPTVALAKPSSIENETRTANFIENHNNYQRFTRPTEQVSKGLQQLQSGRKMTLQSVTAYKSGGAPVNPPDGIACQEYNNGIRCDFNGVAIADGYFGSWWYRSWKVTWDDSEAGNTHYYYGLAGANAPDVYWYHDPEIDFFGPDKFSNGAVPPVGKGYVTVSQSREWGEFANITLSVHNLGIYGPNATFSGHFIISPDPIPVIDPNSALFSLSNGSVMAFGGYGPTESSCNISCIDASQGFGGDPINTKSGVFSVGLSDLSFPTSAGELIFQRSYSSGATSLYNSSLGHGWTHNHDAKLILPSDPGGVAGYVIFQAVTGNQYKFKIESNGGYTAAPGVVASLTKSSTKYTLVTGDKSTFDFDLTGRLTSRANAQGHDFIYHYDTQGRLDKVSADNDDHFIEIHYNSQGRIESVNDHSGREVGYGYDSAGDLVTFVDVSGKTWTYTYEDHLMTLIEDPNEAQTLRIEYDSQGRAFRQWDGLDKKLVELTFNEDGTTEVSDALDNTHIQTYDVRGTLIKDIDQVSDTSEKSYDPNFRPNTVKDSNGASSQLTWSEDGTNLEYIKDALGSETFIEYEETNAPNSPTLITDPLNNDTKYLYENSYFPTLPTRIEHYDSLGTLVSSTDYDYYPPSSGIFAGRIKSTTDALLNETRYEYELTPTGYIETVRVAYDTSSEQTTVNEYDDLGRLIKITDSAGVITVREYDDAGRLTKTINNVQPDNFDPENFVQNLESADNIFNIVTRYRYDSRGNQIAAIDTNWMITRTYYDLANRPIGVVQNLVVNNTLADSEEEATTAINTSFESVQYSSSHPDRNIRTQTVYADNGDMIAAIDPQGVVTRTYYDYAERTQIVVQNLTGQDISDPEPPDYNPAYPDQNVRTETVFDANGNAIATIDVDGIITRTYYDELNRPEITVQNLVGHQIDDPFAPERTNPPDSEHNLRTDMYYDDNGNLIATQDPGNVVTRTYYDAVNRPTVVVQNWTGNNVYTDPAPDRTQGECGSEVNICTETFYDEVGNVNLTVDGAESLLARIMMKLIVPH